MDQGGHVDLNAQVLITKMKVDKEWKDLVIFPSPTTLDTLLTQRPSRREWSQDTRKWLQHLRQRAVASLLSHPSQSGTGEQQEGGNEGRD